MLTKDSALTRGRRRRGIELRALIDAGVGVFVVRVGSRGMTGSEMAEVLVRAVPETAPCRKAGAAPILRHRVKE